MSLLLPVCNAQGGLESQLERVLEILPELTDRFDVVIVDDGSTDDTHEVARDLARRYPQVEVVRHPTVRGMDQAIKSGIAKAQTDVVLVHQTNDWLNAAAVADAVRAGRAKTKRGRPTVLHTDAIPGYAAAPI